MSQDVDTKVVGVKTDLDATREDLKMARSEMGTLIARNMTKSTSSAASANGTT